MQSLKGLGGWQGNFRGTQLAYKKKDNCSFNFPTFNLSQKPSFVPNYITLPRESSMSTVGLSTLPAFCLLKAWVLQVWMTGCGNFSLECQPHHVTYYELIQLFKNKSLVLGSGLYHFISSWKIEAGYGLDRSFWSIHRIKPVVLLF